MCFKDFLMLQTVTDLSSVSISLEIRNLEDCLGMGSRGRQPKPSAILEKHIVFATGQQKPYVILSVFSDSSDLSDFASFA